MDERVERLADLLTMACDFSMPRAGPCPPKRAAYWWTEELAELRRSSVQARRELKRAKRRTNRAGLEAACVTYREARARFAAAIRKAKASAWDSLIRDLDRDPWGRPYGLVMKKLRQTSSRMTESLDPRFVLEIVAALFPRREGGEGRFRPSR